MHEPEISIIVPVHNAGKFLEKCLVSLINQTLKEIEIILVIDRPTDGSDKVAERFAESDSRIRIIYNQENLHTGLSRNVGIDAARGKYIGFMDHDDYCKLSMYEKLLQTACSNQADVTRCNFNCIYLSGKGDMKEAYVYPEVSINFDDDNSIYKYICADKISCVIWNHIYRTGFLKENNLHFLDSRNICSEDSIFFIEVYHKMERFAEVPDYLYSHVFHEKNTGKQYGYRSVKNRISFFEHLYSFLKSNNRKEESICRDYLSENVIKSFYTASRQAFLNLPFGQAMKEIKQIRDNDLIMTCIRSLYKKGNLSRLLKMKPTAILFSFLIKSFK